MQKLKHSGLILLISALFFTASFISIPVTDKLADDYFSESIKAATIAYATTRGVNAVVSVVKESHLELAPAGVGISIAAGQVLDPIDDMTERLSSVLVAAIASLGIQKIGFEISEAVSFKAIAALLLMTVPLLWFNSSTATAVFKPLIKLSLLLLLLRFMLPTSALISHTLYSGWLEPGIVDAMEKLSIVSDSYNELSNMAPEQDQGFFSSMAAGTADKIEKTRQAFSTMVENVETIISSLLNLITAYLAIFVVQVLLLPLFMFWALVCLFKSRALDEFTTKLSDRVTTLRD